MGKAKMRKGGIRMVFRTLAVFRCPACFASTNCVEMGLGDDPRPAIPLCPQRYESWHHKLEEKIIALQLLRSKRSKTANAKKDKLKKEIKRIRQTHKKEIQNDVRWRNMIRYLPNLGY